MKKRKGSDPVKSALDIRAEAIKSRQNTAGFGDLEREFAVDPETMVSEYTRIPALIAFETELYARACRQEVHAKHNRDKVFAEVFVELSGSPQEDADVDEDEPAKPARKRRGLSAEAVKQMVRLDPRYDAAASAYATAVGVKQRHLGRVKAMDAKRDMVISLGAQLRKELEGNSGGSAELDEDDNED